MKITQKRMDQLLDVIRFNRCWERYMGSAYSITLYDNYDWSVWAQYNQDGSRVVEVYRRGSMREYNEAKP